MTVNFSSILAVFFALFSAFSACQEAEVPAGISWNILKIESVGNFRRTIVVSLNERASKNTLHIIAEKVTSIGSAKFNKSIIQFYLPWTVPGKGAWAIADISISEKRIEILGLSIEDEAKFFEEKIPDDRFEIIGRWIDDQPYVAGRLMILHENVSGKFFLDRKYKDGSGSQREAVEKRSSFGRKFEPLKMPRNLEYWTIDRDGNLTISDNMGTVMFLSRKY